ncbi:MAG TPA: DNA polymerase III subunit alpha [Nitrospirota bacterium]|nr:DNA polymerase III subunit alpha [Nitrospirota bacterium]
MHHSDFVHLHLHTEYSLLDGANALDALIKKAVDLKMPAIAVTDHGNLFGALDFYLKATKAGIKPIIGCEMYVAPGSRFEKTGTASQHDESFYHLILLSRDRQGYKNLVKLVTAAYLEGFYYKPRIDKEILRQHSQGLIGMSACLSGEVPRLLLQGRYEDAKKAALEYQDILGMGNFYFELQDNGIPEQEQANRELIRLSKDTGIPLVATNDCHYLNREDHKSHDALLCIQTGKTVKDANRMRFSSETFYVKTPEEMKRSFAHVPEAISNTIAIAERCNIQLELGKYHLPHFPVPDGYTRESFMAELARKGLEDRFREIEAVRGPGSFDPGVYRSRLESEIAMLEKMGFAGYFLIVWDFIRYAKEHGIPVGPGRGSAAGSLVAYSLRITDLDPLPYNLLFERFLNPERISMPDIDVDFCMDRRDEVLKYVTEKYGQDHVTQIITYGTMMAKGVIRDVGRVLDIPYSEVDKVAKLVPNTLNITLEDAIKQEPRFKELMKDSRMAELIEIARSLEGQVRHASKHAAGVVISEEPLTEYVPLFKTPKDEITTQFDMKGVEKIGLVKFDFLGLRTLTVIDKAVKTVNDRLATAPLADSERFSISRIPLNDQKTYDLLSRGETAGIFQLESSGMRDIVVKMKPQCFEDLIALVALYRPGPLQSGMVDDFIKRKKGATKITYELPALEPILKDTYGVIVYQEQVMQIARTLAGYSLGGADLLRRAMGKKDPEVMAKEKVPFLDGAKKEGIDLKKAEKIFDLMAKFAEYGFNKSHSAAYALISYQTAYLKAHYPVEYMAALLTSEVQDTDKVVKYIHEARQMGIDILQPDVNTSMWDFTVVDAHDREAVEPGSTIGSIRFGLAAVKNVGLSAIEAIIEARESKEAFTSIIDFCKKVDQRRVNRRVIEALIKCGAFDGNGARRAQMMEGLGMIIDQGSKHQEQEAIGQFSIFDSLGSHKEASLPDVPEWNEGQLLAHEKESIGFYLSGHPLAAYQTDMARYATATTETLDAATDGKELTICGVIAGMKIKVTKRSQEKMAILNLEDLSGTVEVVVFPDLYKTSHHLLLTDTPLLIAGQLDKSEQGNKIKATRLHLLAEVKKRGTTRMDIMFNATGLTPEDLSRVKDILLRYKGSIPVYLRLRNPTRPDSLISVDREIRVNPTAQLISEIEAVLGAGVVSLG